MSAARASRVPGIAGLRTCDVDVATSNISGRSTALGLHEQAMEWRQNLVIGEPHMGVISPIKHHVRDTWRVCTGLIFCAAAVMSHDREHDPGAVARRRSCRRASRPKPAACTAHDAAVVLARGPGGNCTHLRRSVLSGPGPAPARAISISRGRDAGSSGLGYERARGRPRSVRATPRSLGRDVRSPGRAFEVARERPWVRPGDPEVTREGCRVSRAWIRARARTTSGLSGATPRSLGRDVRSVRGDPEVTREGCRVVPARIRIRTGTTSGLSGATARSLGRDAGSFRRGFEVARDDLGSVRRNLEVTREGCRVVPARLRRRQMVIHGLPCRTCETEQDDPGSVRRDLEVTREGCRVVPVRPPRRQMVIHGLPCRTCETEQNDPGSVRGDREVTRRGCRVCPGRPRGHAGGMPGLSGATARQATGVARAGATGDRSSRSAGRAAGAPARSSWCAA
jgi:hypothetical protein